MSINYGAASSFAIVAYDNLTNAGTVTGDVAYTTGTPPTFSPAIGGGTVTSPVPITTAINAVLGQINGLTVTSMSNNDLNTEFTNILTINGTKVYGLTGNLINTAPFTIIGGPTDYAVFRVTGTIDFGFSIFASYPQNITFRSISDITLGNGTYSGAYISSALNSNINISNSKIIGRAISRHNINMNSNSTIYLPGFLQITLGLAENYAMLGSQFLYMDNAIDVKGFMGSDFLSYPERPILDSNGIQLFGSIPNAPIVNGAAAKQAIADVNTAIAQYLQLPEVYNGPAVGDLNPIITGPGLYTINGNLTLTTPITLNGSATDIYVFNVTGFINIPNYTNTNLSGGLLPQNVIFIASGYIIVSCYYITNGIYISTGDYAINNYTPLIGRLISIDSHAEIVAPNSSITAPQFA